MRQKFLKVLSAIAMASASISTLSQVAPTARGPVRNLPFRVGAGYSNYGSDFNGRLGGPAAWLDFDLPKLSGLQLELETRDLNYNRTGADPNLRQYTFAGGINYAWRYDPAFHPYVKFLAGVANTDFSVLSPNFPNYTHDSRTFYAPGGGLEVRARGRLWIRGDYEYQFWPDFFNHHTENPQGLTVGLFYDFSKFALDKYQP